MHVDPVGQHRCPIRQYTIIDLYGYVYQSRASLSKTLVHWCNRALFGVQLCIYELNSTLSQTDVGLDRIYFLPVNIAYFLFKK